MDELTASRFAETTAPLIAGWSLGSDRADSPSERGASGIGFFPSQSPDLSFRVVEAGARSDEECALGGSLVMTRTVTPRPPTAIRFPEPGEMIGGFRIVSELGHGAFARVYLAEQQDLAARLVALKVAAALGDEPQALARLQHAHIVPIHSIHDDPRLGLRFLCMPYVGGANLAQVLERAGAKLPTQAEGRSLVDALDHMGGRPQTCRTTERSTSMDRGREPRNSPNADMGTPSAVRSVLGRYWARLPWWKSLEDSQAGWMTPEPEEHDQPARRFLRSHTYVQASVWIAARLAEGLAHAHDRGILHRDLKPANILIAADGTPMLLDFNLAAATDPEPDEDDADRAHLGGTLPYMAPEHLDAFNPQGETSCADVDARSDLYSLALILWEMVVGRHPFAEPPAGMNLIDAVRWMTELRRAGAPSARSFNPLIAPSLDAILAKALNPLPSRRYPRVADFAEDLNRFLEDRPNAHAPEPSLCERVTKWWRRNPRARGAGPVAACAVVLLLLVGGLATSFFETAQAARAHLRLVGFQNEFERCQLLLNTSNGPSTHLEEGLALARRIFGDYQVDSASDWTKTPAVQRLPKSERLAIREEMSELLLLCARAQVARTARSSPEPERRAALERAISILNRAERSDPAPSAALFEDRSRYHAALGLADRARCDRENAARRPPVSARDFYLRGTSRAARGDLDGAEFDLGRAVALDPRRFWAWFVLGLCHHDRGRFAEAVGDFNACTLLAPDFAWPHLNRGLALAASGRLDEARAAYDRAVTLSPDFAEALVDRALTLLELDDPAGAERDLSHAIRLGRRDASILAARAESLARLGRRDQAETDFAEALRVRPDDPRLLVARGIARIDAQPQAAESDFRRVLARDPRNVRAHYGIALVLRKTNPLEALGHADRALDLAPSSLDLLRLRAILRARLGDPRAASDSDRLTQTPSTQNLYNAACTLAILSQTTHDTSWLPRAREYLRRAIDLGFSAERASRDEDLAPLRAAAQNPAPSLPLSPRS